MKWRFLAILGAVAVGLAAVVALTSRPTEAEPVEKRPRIWSFDMRDLWRVEIRFEDGSGEAWIRDEDYVWYFDRPGLPRVDTDRWGGGVAFLLSGPGASRRISDGVLPEDLEIFGLDPPHMSIHLEHGADREVIDLAIGDQTPDTVSYFVQMVGTETIYTIDYTWYDIMEGLVRDPPYLPEQ